MINILYLHAGAELYGADKVLLNLLKNIDRRKFHPYVILPNDGPLVNELKKLNITCTVIDYPILRRKYFNIKGIINYILDYRKKSREIIDYINDKNIDFIHVNTIAVLEGIYIKKKICKPLVWHVHEILQKPKFVFKFTSFLIGKYATKIISVSNSVKKHLISSKFIKNEKIITIYNGIDNNIYNKNNETEYLNAEFNIPNEAFTIGMIGRINAIKGQNEFLKIVEPLLEKYSNIYAIILGGTFEGQEWRFDELKNKIRNMSNSNRIKLVDYRNDVKNFHNLFDILVLPSVQPDSLPTVVLESMATEKVVVGYKNGGIIEMVVENETGYLTDIFNNNELMKRIEELYLNRDLYIKMAKKAYIRQTSYFSNDSFIKNIENLYYEIMKGI